MSETETVQSDVAFSGSYAEKAAGAWEADALPTELFPLNDLRGPYLDLGPNRGQRPTPIITRSGQIGGESSRDDPPPPATSLEELVGAGERRSSRTHNGG